MLSRSSKLLPRVATRANKTSFVRSCSSDRGFSRLEAVKAKRINPIIVNHFEKGIEYSDNNEEKWWVIEWDADGTLLKSRCALAHALHLTLKEFGVPEPWKNLAAKDLHKAEIKALHQYERECHAELAIHGHPEIMFTKLFGKDKWYTAYERFKVIYKETHLKHIKLKPGVEDFIDQAVILQENGHKVKLAVVSHQEIDLLSEALDHLFCEKAKAFEYVHGTGSHAINKPDPRTNDIVLNELGINGPARVTYIGDGPSDGLYVENLKNEGVDAQFIRKNRRVFGAAPEEGMQVFTMEELTNSFVEAIQRSAQPDRVRGYHSG